MDIPDSFPDHDRFTHPGEGPSVEELTFQADAVIGRLLTDEDLRLHSTDVVMRAFSGTVNSMDGPTLNRLPATAKSALGMAANASYHYLQSVGQIEPVAEESAILFPETAPQLQVAQVLTKHMQRHVSLVAPLEDDRRQSELYRGLVRYVPGHGVDRSTRVKAEVLAEQRAQKIPYDEDGIREVLRTVGEAFGPVLMGWHDVAPLDVTHQRIVGHASGWLRSVQESLDRDLAQ
jgi:hypothetical protein